MNEENQDDFKYNSEDDFADSAQDSEEQQAVDQDREVSWVGSEFVANHKNTGWFMGFFGLLILIVAAIFILTKDYISTISVAVVGILFAILANHKPRQLSYRIDNRGVNIGEKFYPFEQFKYFSMASDGALGYINLMPLKRFMPDVSIYFPPEERDNIVGILADHLPHREDDERQIDKLAKKFRF
jgi:uncharacterized integral membrane protein